MAVADLEQRTAGMDRQEQRRPRDERLVVHIAAVDRRRSRIITAEGRRRCHPHAAEERPQRNIDSRREEAEHRPAVERDDLHPRIGEVVGQEPSAIAKGVVRIGNRQIDLEDADLERVAGLGAGDRDRAGEHVPARPALARWDAGIDRAQRGLDIGGRDARFLEPCRAVGQQRMNDDGVARLDRQDGLGGRVVMPPGDGLRRGGQIMRLGRQRARDGQPDQSHPVSHMPPLFTRSGKGGARRAQRPARIASIASATPSSSLLATTCVALARTASGPCPIA